MSLCGSKTETDAFLPPMKPFTGRPRLLWMLSIFLNRERQPPGIWSTLTRQDCRRNQCTTTQESLIPQLFLTLLPHKLLVWPSSPWVNAARKTQSILCLYLLINFFSGQASQELYRTPPTTTTNEKQCAQFHYTANPISCFTLCRRVAERGNEWDGTRAELTQIPQSPNMGSTRSHWDRSEGFWAISQSISGSIKPHLANNAHGFGGESLRSDFLFMNSMACLNQEVTLGKSHASSAPLGNNCSFAVWNVSHA